LKTGKAVLKHEKNVQKHVAYNLNFSYTEQNTKSKCMQKVFCVNQHPKTTMRQLTPPKIASNDKHKTEMRQKSPPKKVRQMTCTKLKCVKNHPPKMRQKSCKNALKITP
jgi:hypothetical protein